jgi:hypothetical protein
VNSEADVRCNYSSVKQACITSQKRSIKIVVNSPTKLR